MAKYTCRNWQIAEAPARIELLGDKTRRSEPAQHIIEFPGGAVEVSRLDDGSYWAHIIINQGQALDIFEGLRGARGEVIASRVGRAGHHDIPSLDRMQDIEQIAVLIRPHAPKGRP